MKLLTAIQLIYQGFVKKEEYSRFLLAEKLCGILYPKYKFGDFGRLFLEDRAFIAEYEKRADPGNYHTLDKKYALHQLMQLVSNVPGDTAECGTYRGSSSYFICRRIEGLGKQHHVFDSFEGLPAPGSQDGSFWAKGNLKMPEEVVRQTLKPFDFVVIHRGWIPATFESVKEKLFCFAHIDVDLYQPTWDCLVFFYERLRPGGIILGDDYGLVTCPGATEAFDRFFADKPEPLVHLPTGQALIIKR